MKNMTYQQGILILWSVSCSYQVSHLFQKQQEHRDSMTKPAGEEELLCRPSPVCACLQEWMMKYSKLRGKEIFCPSSLPHLCGFTGLPLAASNIWAIGSLRGAKFSRRRVDISVASSAPSLRASSNWAMSREERLGELSHHPYSTHLELERVCLSSIALQHRSLQQQQPS